MYYIPIILGTGRENNESQKATQLVFETLKDNPEFEFEIIRVKDILTSPFTGEVNQDYISKVNKADGFIIVAPEYNHGYPGELKLLLDMAYNEYAKKPLSIIGVSSGPWGGARVVEQLRSIAIAYGLVPTQKSIMFSNIQDLENNKDKIKKRILNLSEELFWYVKTLHTGRNKN